MSHAEAASILPWLFINGGRVLMVEIRVTIDIDGRRAYDVCVAPAWDVASSIIERCDGLPDAFRRHASIAAALRQTGWTLIRDAAPTRARSGARL
ncbi:MAG: hypothetical protein ACRENC_07255 [Gemmatimonadaceae bacterium]